MMDLTQATTKELADELAKREGVEVFINNVRFGRYEIKVTAPSSRASLITENYCRSDMARILVVKD
jgi:short-subunit dehydrogenase